MDILCFAFGSIVWKFPCLRRARHSVPREGELCHISGFQLRHQRVGSGEVKSRPKSPGQLWASVSGDLHQHLNPSLEPVRSLWEHLGDAVPQGVVMIFEMQCCFILELEYVMCTIKIRAERDLCLLKTQIESQRYLGSSSRSGSFSPFSAFRG